VSRLDDEVWPRELDDAARQGPALSELLERQREGR
jgi:hypothetical protein